jgi:hypothetical protein
MKFPREQHEYKNMGRQSSPTAGSLCALLDMPFTFIVSCTPRIEHKRTQGEEYNIGLAIPTNRMDEYLLPLMCRSCASTPETKIVFIPV